MSRLFRLLTSVYAKWYSRCRFTHDVKTYLEQKPRDITLPRNVDCVDSNNPLAILDSMPEPVDSDTTFPPSIDPTTRCFVFEEKGECRLGFKCRFLGSHVKKLDDGSLELLADSDKVAMRKIETTELNYLPAEALKLVRSKKASVFEVCRY